MSNRTSDSSTERPVRIPIDGVTLDADLDVPAGATGLVIFAHGSGSGRHSPRNRFVARELRGGGLGTLLLDLLTPEEELIDSRTGSLRFDVEMLATRLGAATDWAAHTPELATLPIGYFGASTGAAAALIAAAARPSVVKAIVSRGGRPDLAGHALDKVHAPVLLIVGGADVPVIELNEMALMRIRGEKSLVIVPGATHLFEERGALDDVARLARDWLSAKLGAPHVEAAREPW